jgi:hypothetical protein
MNTLPRAAWCSLSGMSLGVELCSHRPVHFQLHYIMLQSRFTMHLFVYYLNKSVRQNIHTSGATLLLTGRQQQTMEA